MRIALALLACCVLLAGCPREKRALNASRKAVEVAAMTVDLVDAEVDSLYADAASVALAACETSTCYRDALRKWDKTVQAVFSMKASLLMVELALDAWETGSPNGQDSLLGAAACFVQAMVQLQSLLAGLDVHSPALDHGLDYTDTLFGSGGLSCPVGA